MTKPPPESPEPIYIAADAREERWQQRDERRAAIIIISVIVALAAAIGFALLRCLTTCR